MTRSYGWHPSLPDHRDLLADTSTLPVLAEVDPRELMPAIYDQGRLGSCTANAIAAAIAYNMRLDGVNFAGSPSRLDIYYGERALEGTIASDAGAYGRDGLRYAHNIGVIPESAWPYVIAKFAQAPPAVATQRVKIGPYAAVHRSVTDFKRVLSNKQTIALGFSVFSSFESAEVAASGIMAHPAPSERLLGGHEILVVGYLASHPHHALCRNSWSAGWGLDGYFHMPWSVILDRGLSSDFRTIRRPAIT